MLNFEKRLGMGTGIEKWDEGRERGTGDGRLDKGLGDKDFGRLKEGTGKESSKSH